MLDKPKLGEAIILVMMIPGIIVNSIGAGIFAFAFTIEGGGRIMASALGGMLFVGMTTILFVEYQMQRDLLNLHIRETEARLPQPKPTPPNPSVTREPREPRDGGETPTPEFLSAFWQYARTHELNVPSVREFANVAGMNATRIQAMLTRLATWQCIVGRVPSGASGQIAENWTHAQCRQRMISERADYAPMLGNTSPTE